MAVTRLKRRKLKNCIIKSEKNKLLRKLLWKPVVKKELSEEVGK